MKLFICSIALILVQLNTVLGADQRVVCYWPEWNVDAKAPYKHTPQDIDATLCTHIHYAFAVMDETHETLVDSDGSPQPTLYNGLEALRSKNSKLKIILSLGGWGDDSAKYSHIVANATKINDFTAHVIAYLKKYGFDGLDIDWEFPVCWEAECGHGHEADKANYAKWIQTLRTEFDKQTPKLSLSAAVNGGEDISTQAYDFKALGTYLDYVNVMTYDNAGDWDTVTGHHSGFEYSKSTVAWFASKGVPKEKLLIGVPFYGHSFTLKDPANHKLGAPVTGGGKKLGSGEAGSANYAEICDLVKNHNYTKEQSSNGHDPIAYHDNQWIGYDDPNQAYQKAKWSKDNGYGGVIIWEITQDDFHASCCKVAYPMLKAINYGAFGTGAAPSTYGCE